MQQQNTQYRTRINQYIRVPQVRVILPDGTSAGIMNTYEALKLAQDQGLDLVEINPKAIPPVVKITDFGKLKYEQKKNQQQAKKNQKTPDLKEIAFHPNTEINDLNHKLEAAKQFLTDGDKVLFIVKFRGRELAHPEIGREKLEWILQELAPLTASNTPITMEGKNMTTVVSPKTNKAA